MNEDTSTRTTNTTTTTNTPASNTPAGAVNPFTLPGELARQIAAAAWPQLIAEPVADGRGMLIENLLSRAEAAELREAALAQPWIPVGLDGMASSLQPGGEIGSWRASTFSPELAQALWTRLRGAVGDLHQLGPTSPADHTHDGTWRATGVNPLLRLIRYRRGGQLVPHQDGPYVDADGQQRTLMSLVVYLGKSGSATGGATRFIQDPGEGLPLAERDLSDWTRAAREDEVIARVDPPPGSALVFWHRVLHDAEALSGDGEKLIIRSDITFRPEEDVPEENVPADGATGDISPSS